MKVIGCLHKQFRNTHCDCRHIRITAVVRFSSLQRLSSVWLRRPNFQARRSSVPSCAGTCELLVPSLYDRNPLEHGVKLSLASVICLTLVCIGGPADANNVVGRQQAQQAFTRSLSGSTAEGKPHLHRKGIKQRSRKV